VVFSLLLQGLFTCLFIIYTEIFRLSNSSLQIEEEMHPLTILDFKRLQM
jgi:hypothetical protein